MRNFDIISEGVEKINYSYILGGNIYIDQIFNVTKPVSINRVYHLDAVNSTCGSLSVDMLNLHVCIR